MKTHVMRRVDPQTFVAVAEDSEDELIVDSHIKPRATMFRSDSDGSDSIVGRSLLNRSQAAYEQATVMTNNESMNNNDDNDDRSHPSHPPQCSRLEVRPIAILS